MIKETMKSCKFFALGAVVGVAGTWLYNAETLNVKTEYSQKVVS